MITWCYIYYTFFCVLNYGAMDVYTYAYMYMLAYVNTYKSTGCSMYGA